MCVICQTHAFLEARACFQFDINRLPLHTGMGLGHPGIARDTGPQSVHRCKQPRNQAEPGRLDESIH